MWRGVGEFRDFEACRRGDHENVNYFYGNFKNLHQFLTFSYRFVERYLHEQIPTKSSSFIIAVEPHKYENDRRNDNKIQSYV